MVRFYSVVFFVVTVFFLLLILFFWRYRSWQCSTTEVNVTFSRILVHSVPWKRHCVINFFGLMFCLTSFFPAVEESLALTILFWGWCAAAHNVSRGHQIYSVSVLRCYITIWSVLIFFWHFCFDCSGECHQVADDNAHRLLRAARTDSMTAWAKIFNIECLNILFFFAFNVCVGLLA